MRDLALLNPDPALLVPGEGAEILVRETIAGFGGAARIGERRVAIPGLQLPLHGRKQQVAVLDAIPVFSFA